MNAVLRFDDAREAADLAAFLGRLIHYDRAAAVRLQAGGGALAVFGRPPSFEVLAIRTARLQDDSVTLDVTVSAGELLESLDELAATTNVPEAVTGPPWAGVLPPRGGWRPVPGLPEPERMRGAVAAAVAEFRARDEALPEERRTRAERELIGREIWSRTLGSTELPLRAVHAAQSLGFLRPVRALASAGAPSAPEQVALFASGPWLRLRTPYGSVALRRAGLGGLSVTPA
uniref:FAD-binding PCMH-type domain-containing protein n=1 Tax=Streptomyces sp. NBC_00003 TaxID=2903608 RepID=A0AAU2V920_9ACTN